MKHDKRLFIKYFLLFAIGLTLITVAGEIFPFAGRIFEGVGDLIKACGLFFGLAWIFWFIKLKPGKRTVITTLKTASISFADIAIGILALIQLYNVIAFPVNADFWMITAFDYSMLLLYIYQYCQLYGKSGND